MVIAALRRAVEANILPSGGPLLVACSGGRDSMALVEALLEEGRWALHVASVDHGLHPDSAADAEFVVAHWADRVESARRLAAEPEAIRRGQGVEDGARRERYRLLESARVSCGAQCVVTAHHADDQAETLLMRLADGAGLRGLRGVHARRPGIRRPWLDVSRSDIDAYIGVRRVPYVDELTNTDHRFRRNRLRAVAMPALTAALGPEWTKGAARTAGFLQDALDEDRMNDVRSALVFGQGAVGVTLDPRTDAGVIRSAVFSALQSAYDRWRPGQGRGLGSHVPGVSELVKAGGNVGPRSLPHGLSAWREDEIVWVGPRSKAAKGPSPITIDGPCVLRWGPWLVEVAVDADPQRLGARSNQWLSLERAPFPWRMRAWRRGDRYHRDGAPGTKRIARQWSDRKIPTAVRVVLPVLEADGRLVWAGLLGGASDVVASLDGEGAQVSIHWAPRAGFDPLD